jgi:hypothetical protein
MFPTLAGRPHCSYPPPYSPLFSSVMYVRPDSDKLPNYLANSGVKFCGQGRNLSPADSMMLGENNSGKWKETGFIETWATGFLMGIAVCIMVTKFATKRATRKEH